MAVNENESAFEAEDVALAYPSALEMPSDGIEPVTDDLDHVLLNRKDLLNALMTGVVNIPVKKREWDEALKVMTEVVEDQPVRIASLQGGPEAVIESIASSAHVRESGDLLILMAAGDDDAGMEKVDCLDDATSVRTESDVDGGYFAYGADSSGFTAASAFMTPEEEANFDRLYEATNANLAERLRNEGLPVGFLMKRMGDETLPKFYGSKADAIRVAEIMSTYEYPLGLSDERLAELIARTPKKGEKGYKDFSGGTVKVKLAVEWVGTGEMHRSLSVGSLSSGIGSVMVQGPALDRMREAQESAKQGVPAYGRAFEKLANDYAPGAPRLDEPPTLEGFMKKVATLTHEEQKNLAAIMMLLFVNKEQQDVLKTGIEEVLRSGGDFINHLLSTERKDAFGLNVCAFKLPKLKPKEAIEAQHLINTMLHDSGLDGVAPFTNDPPMYYAQSRGHAKESANLFKNIFCALRKKFPRKAGDFNAAICESDVAIMFERAGSIEIDMSGGLIADPAVKAKLLEMISESGSGCLAIGDSLADKILPGLELATYPTKKGVVLRAAVIDADKVQVRVDIGDHEFPASKLVGVRSYVDAIKAAMNGSSKIISIRPHFAEGREAVASQGALGTSALWRHFRYEMGERFLSVSPAGEPDMPYARSLLRSLMDAKGDHTPIVANPEGFMNQLSQFLAVTSSVALPGVEMIGLDSNEINEREFGFILQLLGKTGSGVKFLTTADVSRANAPEAGIEQVDVNEMDLNLMTEAVMVKLTHCPEGHIPAIKNKVKALLNEHWEAFAAHPYGPRLAGAIVSKLKVGDEFLLHADIEEGFKPAGITFDPNDLNFDQSTVLVSVNNELPANGPYRAVLGRMSAVNFPLSLDQIVQLNDSLSRERLQTVLDFLVKKGFVVQTGSGNALRYSLHGKYALDRLKLREVLCGNLAAVQAKVVEDGFMTLPPELNWNTELQYKAYLEHAWARGYAACPQAALASRRLLDFYMQNNSGVETINSAKAIADYLGEGQLDGERADLGFRVAECLLEFGGASDIAMAEAILERITDKQTAEYSILKLIEVDASKANLLRDGQEKKAAIEALLGKVTLSLSLMENPQSGVEVRLIHLNYVKATVVRLRRLMNDLEQVLKESPTDFGEHPEVDLKVLFDAAMGGDSLALKAIRRYARSLVPKSSSQWADGAKMQFESIYGEVSDNHLFENMTTKEKIEWLTCVIRACGNKANSLQLAPEKVLQAAETLLILAASGTPRSRVQSIVFLANALWVVDRQGSFNDHHTGLAATVLELAAETKGYSGSIKNMMTGLLEKAA